MVAGPARVVDHDVDAAEVLDRGVDNPLAVLSLLDVAGNEDGRVAGVYLGEGLATLFLASPVDDDLGTLANERLGDRPADAPSATGDGGDLSFELHDDVPPCCSFDSAH